MSADPYANMTDVEVLERAREALRKVQGYPVGSIERSVRWLIYENAKAELDLRLARHVLNEIRLKDGGAPGQRHSEGETSESA